MMISLKIAEQLKTILPKFEIPKIIFALRQDTLIWDVVSDLKFLDHLLNCAGSDQVEFWTPSNIGFIYYCYDKDIPEGDFTCDNLIEFISGEAQNTLTNKVLQLITEDTVIEGITSACILAQKYRENHNWKDIFTEIFSPIVYQESRFIETWHPGLTFLFGMVDDFSPIEKIIFCHFPFHDSFLMLHKILLGYQQNEETASRHLSHLFMDLSTNEMVEVIRYLSLRKYQNSALFFTKILMSKTAELLPVNDVSIELSDQETAFSPEWTESYSENARISVLDSVEKKINPLSDLEKLTLDSDLFRDIFLAEKLAHEGDTENSKILAKNAVEGIRRLSSKEFFDKAETNSFLIDPIQPVMALNSIGLQNEAVGLGKLILEIFPLYQPMYFLMSSIFGQLNMVEQQQEYAELGTYCIYGDFSGNRKLAEIYEKSGVWQKSLKERKYIAEGSNYPNTQDLFAYGNSAFNNGYFELAIEIGLRIIDAYPNHGWSCLLVGESYLLMDYPNQAIPYLNRATLLMENEIKPWVLLSQAYSKINDQPMRYQTINNADSRYPNDSSIILEHARYLLDNFRKDEGYAVLRELIHAPHLPAKIILSVGTLYEINGDFAAANLIYEANKENWGENLEFDLRLGVNYHILGEFDKAILSLDKYLQAHPDNFNIWTFFLNALESRFGDGLLFDNTVSSQDKTKLLGKIFEACRNIILVDPNNLHTRILLAEFFLAESKIDEALEIYKELPGDADLLTNAEIWRLLAGSGIAEFAAGNYIKSASILESAFNLEPSNLTVLSHLSEAYANSGSTEKALEVGYQYLQRNRTDLQVISWYFGFIQKYANDLIGAGFIDRVLKSGPVSLETSINLAEMHIQNERMSNAKSVLDSIPRQDNLSVSDARFIAQVYVRLGDYESAWQIIFWAIETKKSTDIELMADAVGILIIKGEFGEAINYLDIIITSQPDDTALLTLMGDLFNASGDIDKAIGVFNKALELINIGAIHEVHFTTGRYFSYLSGEYSKNLGLKNNILLKLSRLYQHSGNLLKSLEYALKCVDLDPEHLPSINYTVELASQLLQFDLVKELASRVKEYSGPEKIDNSHESITEYVQAVENIYCVLCEHELSAGNFDEAKSILMGLKSLNCDSFRMRLLEIRLSPANMNREKILSEFQLLITVEGIESKDCYPGNIFDVDISLNTTENQNAWIIDAAIGLSVLETAYNHAKANLLLHPHSPLSYHSLIRVIAHCLDSKTMHDELEFLNDQLFFERIGSEFQEDIQQAFSFLENNPDLNQQDINVTKRIISGLVDPDHVDIEEFADLCVGPQMGIFLSSIYRQRGQVKELLMLANKFPKQPGILINAALGIYKQDWETGYKLAQNATGSARENIICLPVLAKICEYNKRYKEAYERIQVALTYFPEEPLWHKNAARLAFMVDKPAEVLYHLQKTIGIMPDDTEVKIELGMALMKNNQPDQAIDQYLSCLEKLPDDYRVHVGLARAYAATDNFEQASMSIENATKLAPQNFETWLVSAVIANEGGDSQLALEFAEKMYAIQKNNVEVITTYTEILKNAGQLDKACLIMEEAVRTVENIPVDSFIRYVEMVASLKGSKAAIEAMDLVKYSFLNQPLFLRQYSLCHFRLGMTQQAELYAFQAQKIDPSYPGINHLLAIIYKSKGFVDMTEKLLKDEIRVNPKNCLESYIELAEIQKDKSDFTQALKTYRLTMDQYPKDYRAYYQTGLILKDYKNYKEAEKMLTRAVDLSPANSKIRRQLAAVAALNLVHNSQEAFLANDL